MTLVFTRPTYANWFQDIINAINEQGIISNQFLSMLGEQSKLTNENLDVSNAHLNSIEEAERIMKDALTGRTQWGEYQVHDYQSYGGEGESWIKALQAAESGKGTNELAKKLQRIALEFPIEKNIYTSGIHNKQNQKYYALKAQALLVNRAASELDYDKVQAQIAYQQMLQKQIGKTDNLKSAIDLSNRINVEGNLINLEILRQTALINQQQAIKEQGTVNSALQNAKFLSK